PPVAWSRPRAGGARPVAPAAGPGTFCRTGYSDISWDLLLVVAVGTAHDLPRRRGLSGDQPQLAPGPLPLFLQLGGAGELRTGDGHRTDWYGDDTSVAPEVGEQLLQRPAAGADLAEQGFELGRVGFGQRPDRIEGGQDLGLGRFVPGTD